MSRPLVLASTSVYRRELLERLRVPFTTARPDVDEAPQEGETPVDLAARLALAKAQAVAALHPGAWVIGSDQVADLDGVPLGKPGNRAGALAQLAALSDQAVSFYTAVALVGPAGHPTGAAMDRTRVRVRALGAEEIARYVDAEQPYDCAGSFKCEGLGIALFEGVDNRDPTALVGLPLVALCRLLRDAGFVIP